MVVGALSQRINRPLSTNHHPRSTAHHPAIGAWDLGIGDLGFDMKPPKVVFVCQECGAQAPKWMGRCVECGAWNSLVEERPAFADGFDSASAGRAANRYAQFSTSGAAKL